MPHFTPPHPTPRSLPLTQSAPPQLPYSINSAISSRLHSTTATALVHRTVLLRVLLLFAYQPLSSWLAWYLSQFVFRTERRVVVFVMLPLSG